VLREFEVTGEYYASSRVVKLGEGVVLQSSHYLYGVLLGAWLAQLMQYLSYIELKDVEGLRRLCSP
jgi:hypothetical protein